jgi:hypothetical protein
LLRIRGMTDMSFSSRANGCSWIRENGSSNRSLLFCNDHSLYNSKARIRNSTRMPLRQAFLKICGHFSYIRSGSNMCRLLYCQAKDSVSLTVMPSAVNFSSFFNVSLSI